MLVSPGDAVKASRPTRMLWLMSASEVCIGPPGFIRLHRFSVVGVR